VEAQCDRTCRTGLATGLIPDRGPLICRGLVRPHLPRAGPADAPTMRGTNVLVAKPEQQQDQGRGLAGDAARRGDSDAINRHGVP
jgi:hypothetical protein